MINFCLWPLIMYKLQNLVEMGELLRFVSYSGRAHSMMFLLVLLSISDGVWDL